MLGFFTRLFKREPVVRFEDAVLDMPDVPCGDKQKHYYWTLVESGMGLGCPLCRADELQRQKDRELDLLADKILQRLERRSAL